MTYFLRNAHTRHEYATVEGTEDEVKAMARRLADKENEIITVAVDAPYSERGQRLICDVYPS
jgi:hypothetical protein